MDSDSTSRRTLLKIAGGTAVAGSLAGCSGLSPFASDGSPAYREWVPASSVSNFAYLDTSRSDVGESDIAQASGLEREPDALAGLLLLYAGYGTVTLTLGGGVGVLRNATLAALVPDDLQSDQLGGEGESDAETGTPENSTIDGVLVADQALVLYGDIDVAELREAITPTYEETDSRDGYTVFARPGEADPAEFAAGDDAVVLPIGPDSDEIVTTMLDTVTGNGERLVDQDDMGWAVDQAGSGHLVYGSLDSSPPEPATENDSFDLGSLFEGSLPWNFRTDATGVVSSTSREDDRIVGEIALVYDQTADVPAQSEIQNQVTPTSADEYDVSVDGTQVTITGEWKRGSGSATENTTN
jgi:hypothetical protein